jgi:hypothetical protein
MATRKMNRRTLKQYEESEGLAARAMAGVRLARAKRATAKRYGTKKAKRLTRAQINMKKWGPSGQAQCSAFFVENVTKERDEALASLLTVQQQNAERVELLDGAINLLNQFVGIFTADEGKTSVIVRCVLNARAMIDRYTSERNQRAEYRTKA